jgi:hypothetical protein
LFHKSPSFKGNARKSVPYFLLRNKKPRVLQLGVLLMISCEARSSSVFPILGFVPVLLPSLSLSCGFSDSCSLSLLAYLIAQEPLRCFYNPVAFVPWRSLVLLPSSCFSLLCRFRDLLPPIVSLLGFHLPFASGSLPILQRFHPIWDLASPPSGPDKSGRSLPGYANPSSGFLTYSPVLSLSGEDSHSHFRNPDRFLNRLRLILKQSFDIQ